ncbi:MAG: tetratricopeptide repeat protein, partial [Spirochaetales bacterium]|nr:tetratricopeptide repeat protein [Spirochaetales bacterium]
MEPRRVQNLHPVLTLTLVLSATLAGAVCCRDGPAPPGWGTGRACREECVQRYVEGRRLYSEARLEEALAVLLENQRRDPDFSENSHLIGKIHFFRGDYARAREAWDSTLERNPHHLDSRKWLARLHLLEGRPEVSEALVVAGLADSAEDPELLILLGKSRRAQDDLAGALECYRKAQTLAERVVEASLELA